MIGSTSTGITFLLPRRVKHNQYDEFTDWFNIRDFGSMYQGRCIFLIVNISKFSFLSYYEFCRFRRHQLWVVGL